MVKFNDLKISYDGHCFTVYVSIDSASYYAERYITDIYIDSDSTFNNSVSPSDKAIHIEMPNGKSRTFRKVLTVSELSKIITSRTLKNHMIYVFVELDGPISGDAPCGSDTDMFLGVAVDWNGLYHGSLGYMKQITRDCCSIPKEFIDYILKMKALEMALKTGHYTVAKNIWDKFFCKRRRAISSICGCNK